MTPWLSIQCATARSLLAAAVLCAATLCPGQDDKAIPAGSDTCRACHDEQYARVMKTAHAALFDTASPGGAGRSASEPKAVEGCESCHGAGTAHVEAGGDPQKIFRFAGNAAEARRLCQTCHPMNPHGAHDRRQISCTRCHALHGAASQPRLLAKPEMELCGGCHR